MMPTPLVTVSWLKEHLEDEDIIILDATIPIATDKDTDEPNPIIKNARFFDLKNDFSDKLNSLPNTMPSAEAFEIGCRELGVDSNSKIVVYDAKGIYSSARVWFMFTIMGHKNVAVLNGGLPAWLAAQGACSEHYNTVTNRGDFKADFDSCRLKDATYLINNIESQESLVLDARNASRFLGEVPEPRADLMRGHIPKAINLPFSNLLENGKMISKERLLAIFESLILEDKPLVFSCGSGLTACIPILAASIICKNKTYLYDGSWTEWGDGVLFPIEK